MKFKVVEADQTSFIENDVRMMRTTKFTTADYKISKREKGYTVSAVRTAFDVTKDGESAKSKLSEAATGVPITIMLDSSGIAFAVKGIDSIMARFDALIGDSAGARAKAMLQPGELENQMIEGWNDRITPLIDKPADSGAFFYHRQQIKEPLGNPVMYGRSTVEAVFEQDGRRLAKVRTSSFSTLNLLARHFKIDPAELLRVFSMDSLQAQELRRNPLLANLQQVRVIDVNTLLTVSEKSELEVMRIETDSTGRRSSVGLERKTTREIEFQD